MAFYLDPAIDEEHKARLAVMVENPLAWNLGATEVEAIRWALSHIKKCDRDVAALVKMIEEKRGLCP